jgi:hypothetical protein
MKVKELIDLLLDCDKELDVVNYRYEDSVTVKEETVHTFREDGKGAVNGGKKTSRHVILEFAAE